ncbi:putative transposase [Orientia chuto str. Dubai]|uniref:Putative transposase n=1 Tax=Orientia chuto str. Dubai TaxID=1359168 RepID=A0A0F3MK67_9RICK|nr:hypothetical protein [Candidatus Orientia mediorientalis]KJV56120.1 putative transposase [Orientia chuto str. Dubai]
MKYVHSMLAIWEEFLELYKDAVLIDQKREYIYMTSLLWYTENKVSKNEQSKLEQILAKNLSKEEAETLMVTIAEKYIDEGRAEGIEFGEAKAKKELALMKL